MALAATLSLAVSACGDDGPSTPTPTSARDILVLDGFVQPGVTFLADTGAALGRVAFGPPSEFDAGAFHVERDTVLAVSSKAAGDLLYVMSIRTASVRRVQLPARSNPGSARLLRGGSAGGAARIAVALRDSGSVAIVEIAPNGTVTSTRIANAGTCPTDVFEHGGAIWIADANTNCRGTYAVQGPPRLIRVPATGTARDTITIAGARATSVSVVVTGDVAYVAAGGDADFSSVPYALVASGTVTKVDLVARRTLAQRPMPAGSYGASTRLGLDGFLYVSLYEGLDSFRERVLKLRPDDMTFTGGGATAPWLPLVDAAGAGVTCGAAMADALGRVHCLVSGAAAATSLLVFDPAFRQVRRVAAGQGGVDLALR